MGLKVWIILILMIPSIAISLKMEETNAIEEVRAVGKGSAVPDGDVDLINNLRQRRSGTAGWDPNAPWGQGMDRGEYGGYGGGVRSGVEVGPGGSRAVDVGTPGPTEAGTKGRSKGGGRNKGTLPKGSAEDVTFPEEIDGKGGRRVRPGNRPKMTPYQRWLQSQLINQQLRPPPQGPEQGLIPPVPTYPRPPPPPPDYQKLKSRQFRPRLQKLDAYFGRLGVMSEDCRQRLLCEVAREPARYFPLSNVLEEEAGFTGNYQYLTSQLVNSTEGARLLSYMEANLRGQDRSRTCDAFQRRCLSRTEDMINFQSLIVWREMIRWLTIHVLTKVP